MAEAIAGTKVTSHPATIATLLALTAGFVGTVGFIALLGLFTAHVTSNFVLIGASLVGGHEGWSSTRSMMCRRRSSRARRLPCWVRADRVRPRWALSRRSDQVEQRSLQETHDFACLFISHDGRATEQIADRVLVTDAGKAVEGPTSIVAAATTILFDSWQLLSGLRRSI